MTIDISKVKIGDKVCYQPEHYKEEGKYENGMVKSIPDDTIDSLFVVYNCGGDWRNFKDYTAAKTNLRDLQIGWKHE